MLNLRLWRPSKKLQISILTGLASFPLIGQASFIESTMGTAVVNDASATYYNPAALTLLKGPQIITLGSSSFLYTHFSGEFIQSRTNFRQSGTSSANTHYFLPSFYLAIPTKNKITMGLAVISNYFTRDIEDNSILRYVQSSNRIQNIDVVPAIGLTLNKFLSLGVGLNFSYANILLQPRTGFPTLNIPDSQSRNEANGLGLGGDIGLLLQPSASTTMGLNYRSAITYRLQGTSVYKGLTNITSDQYSFNFWTPARYVFSINQFLTPHFGLICTVQRIQWSIFQTVKIHGIATQAGLQPLIVNAQVPYHLHNTWLITLGTHYRVIPKWIIRVASSYNQASNSGKYQISNGDSITVGGSTGYEIFKNIILDASYAHAFIQNKKIFIANNRNTVSGVNSGSVNAASLKLTLNLV